MTSHRSWLAALTLGATLALAPAVAARPVDSENRAAARALGKEGIALYRQGKHAEALDRLSRAHAVVGLTTTGLWRAKCLEKLGRLVEAAEQYLQVTRMKPGDEAPQKHLAAIDEARAARQDLLPRIPKVRVVARGGGASAAVIRIDGKLVPAALLGELRPVDPGDHVLVVEHAGEVEEQLFRVAEGQTVELPVDVSGSAAAGPPAER
ncbi:MAG: tetratricopeptide repeat protein, partial [Deltaproteobacteria bacterium]|nr:tetratricopeptide repeat protein [Deltaproteobacteria bacterium]MBW2532567.1 tetratricopeptide repeat protein [Deltaproteobacteria bacterium]